MMQGNIDFPSITIMPKDIEMAREFADIKAKTTPSPIRRSADKKISDIIEGKVGEIVFAKYMYEQHIYLDVDFTHYEKGEDDADFRWGNIQIDVKTINYYSKYLLIPCDSFDDGKRCDFYPLVRLDKHMTSGQILGYALKEDIQIATRDKMIGGYKLDLLNYILHYSNLRRTDIANHIELLSKGE